MNDDLRQLVSSYEITPEAVELVKNTKIVFLVGPTAAGKDSIKHILLNTGEYHHIVSHTTRPLRVNRGVLETDGLEYHFIDFARAEEMLRHGKYIEANIYSQNIYGTSVQEIQIAHDENKIAITDLEVQGVAQYKAISQDVLAVFIVPPSFTVWQERLKHRYGDTIDEDDYRRRMQTAADEFAQLETTDFYVPVVNDDRDAAAAIVNRLAHGKLLTDEEVHHAQTVVADLQREVRKYLDSLA